MPLMIDEDVTQLSGPPAAESIPEPFAVAHRQPVTARSLHGTPLLMLLLYSPVSASHAGRLRLLAHAAVRRMQRQALAALPDTAVQHLTDASHACAARAYTAHAWAQNSYQQAEAAVAAQSPKLVQEHLHWLLPTVLTSVLCILLACVLLMLRRRPQQRDTAHISRTASQQVLLTLLNMHQVHFRHDAL